MGCSFDGCVHQKEAARRAPWTSPEGKVLTDSLEILTVILPPTKLSDARRKQRER